MMLMMLGAGIKIRDDKTSKNNKTPLDSCLKEMPPLMMEILWEETGRLRILWGKYPSVCHVLILLCWRHRCALS